jgi:hypothetical protein
VKTSTCSWKEFMFTSSSDPTGSQRVTIPPLSDSTSIPLHSLWVSCHLSSPPQSHPTTLSNRHFVRTFMFVIFWLYRLSRVKIGSHQTSVLDHPGVVKLHVTESESLHLDIVSQVRDHHLPHRTHLNSSGVLDREVHSVYLGSRWGFRVCFFSLPNCTNWYVFLIVSFT